MTNCQAHDTDAELGWKQRRGEATRQMSEWYQKLDSNTKKEVRQLHQVKPLWNLTAILFIVLWILGGIAVLNAPHWTVQCLGYVFIGTIIHGIGNFMHEGIHGNLFRKRVFDRWFGFLAGVPVLFPITAYGVNHLRHHKYACTERDPDEMKNLTKRKGLLTAFFYVWFLIGSVIYSVYVPLQVHKTGSRKERISMVFERVIILLFVAGLLSAAYWFAFWDVVVHSWFIPLVVTNFLGNTRGWAEHQLTTADHPIKQTRTVRSNRVFSFFNIHLNYHLEHHLFPRVPWYNLPQLHRLLLPEYEKVGVSIYNSYFLFIYDALRVGVHGLTPDFDKRVHANSTA
jgi:fatty acid desaturase